MTDLKVLAYGTSDWNITPIEQNYQDQDEIVAEWLLQWVIEEAKRSNSIDLEQLYQWLKTRKQQLSQAKLGIIVHQLDFLAEKF